MPTTLARFVRTQRKALGYTQVVLANRAGVGVRFVHEVEQGKHTLRMDKVNLLLEMFGHSLSPTPISRGSK
ncbi:MAG: helix-turn-helix domain-containing protein [Rhodobacterales bacterium]|nr:helix-turn-helix domain-containing protein [Rhodobacterales bacterium]